DPLRIGVFICHCGSNIAGVVDVKKVEEEIKTAPDVAYVERNLYTCSEESQHSIIKAIQEHDLNRVIIASCSPRTHLPLFQGTCRRAGLNPYLVEFASIRELVSWVHMNAPEEATKKARDHILMSLAKARYIQPLHDIEVDILPSALIIGGGIAGMTAALAIAMKGFKVYLAEKQATLGGFIQQLEHVNMNSIATTEILNPLIESVVNHPNINIFLSSTIKEVKGSVGNFNITIDQDGKEQLIEAGSIIVAVGGKEFKPEGYYNYGKKEHIYTNSEFERGIINNHISDGEAIGFIQCVGSREKQGRTYCSLTCCSDSIKNALFIKDKYPNSQVYIFYRDIRVFFEDELNYRKAREKGINFIQYTPDNPPIIDSAQPKIKVKVYDAFVRSSYNIPLDKLVLATPIIAWEENKTLSELLKVPIDKNGFFLEAHTKLRPVDFATDGIFLCGTAHGPKNIKESVSQALAAASRALILLMKGKAIVEGITSWIDEEKCIGCGRCVEVCPYNANELIEIEKKEGLYIVKVKKARINSAVCKGCGACVAECPVGAIDQRHFTKYQITKMIESLMEG
ncbi:MAG: CoB--CoM heterodisulfide reductase iron-sulfur subunit A family protein, partial [Promethearchaeota archaeon]